MEEVSVAQLTKSPRSGPNCRLVDESGLSERRTDVLLRGARTHRGAVIPIQLEAARGVDRDSLWGTGGISISPAEF
jgi:hypothetical protein